MIAIREAGKDDLPLLHSLYDAIGKKDDGYFEHALAYGSSVLIAACEGRDCGFCLLNWRPRYSLYRKLEIPEIQDLNVLPDNRRKGIASSMIKWCEGMARSKGCTHMGISVGLGKDYGPAQILYVRMGYEPDGNGVTYDREAVAIGRAYPVDDDLALMMIKAL